jgi:mRNA-degrading endonuclease RelE of RelBE toxin-antitoxin system
MSYKVFLSNKAGKQYKKLDSHIRDKIKSNFDGMNYPAASCRVVHSQNVFAVTKML